MRILISGGPGSGCTSTASVVGAALNLSVFDSDSFFHKPTHPPFQEQYSPSERRERLISVLADRAAWIVSGSIATWELLDFSFTHGLFLDIRQEERLRRLELRQQAQFGLRIESGGDMADEHTSFMEWASGYENRTGSGRNMATDRCFLESRCNHFMAITEVLPIEQVTARIIEFLAETSKETRCALPTPTSR